MGNLFVCSKGNSILIKSEKEDMEILNLSEFNKVVNLKKEELKKSFGELNTDNYLYLWNFLIFNNLSNYILDKCKNEKINSILFDEKLKNKDKPFIKVIGKLNTEDILGNIATCLINSDEYLNGEVKIDYNYTTSKNRESTIKINIEEIIDYIPESLNNMIERLKVDLVAFKYVNEDQKDEHGRYKLPIYIDENSLLKKEIPFKEFLANWTSVAYLKMLIQIHDFFVEYYGFKTKLGLVNDDIMLALIALKEAFLTVADIEVIDVDSNADHNRTVFTYKGEPQNILEATKRLAAKAVELINMTKHKGSHPRIGAVDVVPFIPVRDVTTQEAVYIAKEFGKYLGGLGVPVYFYEDAQDKEYRKALPKIRKGQYEALEETIKDEEWYPDEGPKEFNPKSGATVTGARFPLVAFNINLDTENLDIGKEIVKSVRAAAGGYTYVRAIALSLEEKKQVQVSMNMINYEKTPIHRVFETIKFEAQRYNVNIVDIELVEPVPIYALRDVLDFYLRISKDFSLDQIYS